MPSRDPVEAFLSNLSFVAERKNGKATIKKVSRSSRANRKSPSNFGSVLDPSLSETLEAAFVEAVKKAKRENARLSKSRR